MQHLGLRIGLLFFVLKNSLRMVLVMNCKLLRAYVGCWDNCVNIQGTKNIKILAKFPQPSAGLFPSVVCPYFGSVFAMGFARILPTESTWVYPRWFCLLWVFFWITPERRFSSSTISSCPNDVASVCSSLAIKLCNPVQYTWAYL